MSVQKIFQNSLLVENLLKLFHILPDGLKLYLRSFKKQEPELYELDWLVEKNTIAIDIGANKGAYTYALCKAVGKKGLVVAIEPIEDLAVYLRQACKQLCLPAKILQCCLSSSEGVAELFIPSQNGELQTGFASLDKSPGGEGSLREVSTKKLDEVLKDRDRRVSFIKCDVEGHEIEVFRGASEILKSDRPNLVVEIEQRHFKEPIERHFAFFRDHGYTAFYLNQINGQKNLSRVDSHQTQSFSLVELFEGDNYVYNFIFLPEESVNSEQSPPEIF